MKRTIQIWIEDPRIEKDGDFYTAYSDQLQLVACGFSRKEADERLDGVIQASLNAMAKEGVIFETLQKLNIAIFPDEGVL